MKSRRQAGWLPRLRRVKELWLLVVVVVVVHAATIKVKARIKKRCATTFITITRHATPSLDTTRISLALPPKAQVINRGWMGDGESHQQGAGTDLALR
jgi:hypothetical protein